MGDSSFAMWVTEKACHKGRRKILAEKLDLSPKARGVNTQGSWDTVPNLSPPLRASLKPRLRYKLNHGVVGEVY